MVRRVIIALILVVAMATPTLACSSFAVYSTHGPVFGMNWDLPTRDEWKGGPVGFFEDLNPRIMITSRPGVKTFGLGSNPFKLNPFYNDFGVFGTAQAIYPPIFVPGSPEPLENPHPVMLSGIYARGAKDMVNALRDVKLFQLSPAGERQITNHWLFADNRGEALIIEPGVEENYFLPMAGDYILMTNFLNHRLDSAPRIILSLDSDRRYRTADQMINASLGDFGLNEALYALEAVKQSITKFSFVVVSEEENVYMAVLGDFSRIWRIDFEKRTISTFRGFRENRIEALGEVGFSLEELLEWR